MRISSLFQTDPLNGFIGIAIAVFSLLTICYSLKFMKGRGNTAQYYFWVTLTVAAAMGAVLARNLILLLVLWGFLGLTLYLLIRMAGPVASSAAKKTFIIIGGTDALMLFGFTLIHYLTGTFQIDQIKLSLASGNSPLATIAYLCIAVACFAKAGSMPFHSWIPDCAEKAPLPVVAFLPASLDKLLGIYLLARVSLYMFSMSQAMNVVLMVTGVFTIIAAVMMALVQHNMKRLMGYHAISQVGYMILGIGTGTPVGIAGGLFHMLNNAIYKSCLFFTAGNVEYRVKTTELNELGGLSKLMPFTYISCLIASLSIAGIPPFNGFISKWMIYQGLIGNLQQATQRWQMALYMACLAAAMFGSALTLASFVKLLHAVFLGQKTNKGVAEVPWMMWLPCVLLAASCVIFGLFAGQIPFKYFIYPLFGRLNFLGSWNATVAVILVIVSLALGFFLFKMKLFKPKIRQDTMFVGGEGIDFDKSRVSGAEFYNTVTDMNLFAGLYAKAQKGAFDIYEQIKKPVFYLGEGLRRLHNGVLPTYLVWCLLGMVAFFFWSIR